MKSCLHFHVLSETKFKVLQQITEFLLRLSSTAENEILWVEGLRAIHMLERLNKTAEATASLPKATKKTQVEHWNSDTMAMPAVNATNPITREDSRRAYSEQASRSFDDLPCFSSSKKNPAGSVRVRLPELVSATTAKNLIMLGQDDCSDSEGSAEEHAEDPADIMPTWGNQVSNPKPGLPVPASSPTGATSRSCDLPPRQPWPSPRTMDATAARRAAAALLNLEGPRPSAKKDEDKPPMKADARACTSSALPSRPQQETVLERIWPGSRKAPEPDDGLLEDFPHDSAEWGAFESSRSGRDKDGESSNCSGDYSVVVHVDDTPKRPGVLRKQFHRGGRASVGESAEL